MKITESHKHTLINIAEWTITRFLESGDREPLPTSFEIDETLSMRTGAFVSVYIEEELRGCIGTFSESRPLYKNVHQLSFQSAFEDNRFEPVTENEVFNLGIEISILSPKYRVNGPDEIEIGKHGIYLIHGSRHATLLPQVAVNNNWDAVRFLECCAKNKLGLHRQSWKDSEIYVYEAIVFHS